jgi:ATP-binding cassette subfamily B protein
LKESLPGLLRLLRHAGPALYQLRWRVARGFGAVFTVTLMRLAEPWPLKVVLDHVIPGPEGAPPPPAWLAALEPMTVVALAAVGLIAIRVLRSQAVYAQKVGFAIIGNHIVMGMRNELYRHLQRLSLSFHHRARTGDLIVRLMSDVNRLKDVAVSALIPMLANVLILFGMLGVMFVMNWQLALLSLVIVPFFWVTNVRLGRRIHKTAKKQREREGRMAATATEGITAVDAVKALSLESVFQTGFEGQGEKTLKEDVKATRLAANLERSVEILIAIGTALVLWQGSRLALTGALTAGELVVFLTYLRRAFRPAQDFAKYTHRIARASAAGDRVLDVLEREPDVKDREDAVEAPRFEGRVRFEQVGFAYEEGRAVLDGFELEVAPGQRVALVGPSGIGKSTVLSLLLRLYEPTAGAVTIDGRDLRDYTVASLRAQISVVPQETILFHASVAENIVYGALGSTAEQVQAAAELANARGFIEALPEGYHTVIGERGATLSGGQRQRIAVARAAIRDAPLLILDEPTTGLDEESERVVVEALERLAKGRTTFVVTHDLAFAARSDVVVYIHDGKVLERGSHQELLERGGRYAELYGLQGERR